MFENLSMYCPVLILVLSRCDCCPHAVTDLLIAAWVAYFSRPFSGVYRLGNVVRVGFDDRYTNHALAQCKLMEGAIIDGRQVAG